jgi:hypothetical protein
MNEYSIISWSPVGSALYTVRLETPTGGVLYTVTDIAGVSIPAADLLLDAGAPRAGVTAGGTYKIRVQTQGVFGTSNGTVTGNTVLSGPVDTSGITVS